MRVASCTSTRCSLGITSKAAPYHKSNAQPFATNMSHGTSSSIGGAVLLSNQFGLAGKPCAVAPSSSTISTSSRGRAARCQASAVSESAMAVTEAQEEACRAFLDAQGSGASNDAAALDEKAAAMLLQAATKKDVAPPLVLGAMVWLERNASTPVALDVLSGTWRLVFSSATPIKAFQYIPVHEDAVVAPSANSIDLVSFIGPLETRFLGSFEWRGPTGGNNANDSAGGNADMEFGFNRIQVSLGPFSLMDKDVAERKMKTYRYYWRRAGAAGEEVVLARSSGGGLTLLLRS